MCRCVYLHAAGASGVGFPRSWSDRWLRIIWSRSWAPNSGLLEEQKMLITTEHLTSSVLCSIYLSTALLHTWFLTLSQLSAPLPISPSSSFPHPHFHFTSHPQVTLSVPSFQLMAHSFLALVHAALTIPRFFTTCLPGHFTLIPNRLTLGVPKTELTICSQVLFCMFFLQLLLHPPPTPPCSSGSLGSCRTFHASSSSSSFPSYFCF